jgi:hypothetical protein
MHYVLLNAKAGSAVHAGTTQSRKVKNVEELRPMHT